MPSKWRFGKDHVVDDERPSILIMGIGGAGRNIVEGIGDIASNTVKVYEVGTSSRPPKLPHISISKEDMNSAYHSDIGIDERPLSRSERKLRDKIKDFDIVYLISGLGGRTGSWTIPVCGEICKNNLSFSFGFFAKPFDTESDSRKKLSEEAQKEALKFLDGAAIFSNSKLLEINPHLPIKKAFDVMNKIIRIPLVDLNSVVTGSDIPVLKKFCHDVNEFKIGAGYGSGRKKGLKASKEALRSSWLEDTKEYKKLMVIVSSSDGEKNMIVEDALEEIEKEYSRADMIWGLREEPDLGERTRVTLLGGK